MEKQKANQENGVAGSPVETITIGSARSRGAIDFVAGVKVGENPFDEHDARHWAWMEGWTACCVPGFHKNCHDCGQFLERKLWVAKDHNWKKHALCAECFSNYDDSRIM